jgi:hypothetical protein
VLFAYGSVVLFFLLFEILALRTKISNNKMKYFAAAGKETRLEEITS